MHFIWLMVFIIIFIIMNLEIYIMLYIKERYLKTKTSNLIKNNISYIILLYNING